MSDQPARYRLPIVFVAASAVLLALGLALLGQGSRPMDSGEGRQAQIEAPPPVTAHSNSSRGASTSRPQASLASQPPASTDLSAATTAASPAPLLVPLTEDSVVSHFQFAGVQASATLNGKATALDGALGSGNRYPLVAEVATPIRIRIPHTEPGQMVRVDAPNGGKIARRNGRLEFRADGGAVDLDLAFTPTLGNGAYTVSVEHAGDVLTYQFWVGPEHPQGQPGTPFVPAPAEVLAAEMASIPVSASSAE